MGWAVTVDAPWLVHVTATATSARSPSTCSMTAAWRAYQAGVAECPLDRGRFALVVTETTGGDLFRFCCVACGWCTPFFIVDGDRATSF